MLKCLHNGKKYSPKLIYAKPSTLLESKKKKKKKKKKKGHEYKTVFIGVYGHFEHFDNVFRTK